MLKLSVKFLAGMEILNKKNKFYFLIVLAFFVFIFSLNYKHENNLNYLKISDAILKTEIVSTPEALTRGLSGRDGVGKDEGMLFVFNYPGKYKFWMKDMKFPIDMIWFDQDMKIIYIQENVYPESYPAVFGPEQNSSFVLEVQAGFSLKHKLQIGDKALLY